MGASAQAGAGTTPDGSADATRVPPEFRRVWLAAIVRGVLLLVLGLLLLIDPVRQDLERLRWVLGLFLLADGVVAALSGLWHRHQPAWRVWLTQTVVDVVFGVVVLVWPDLTARALYYVLAAWAIALGVTVVVTAGVLARSRDIEWSWSLTAGVVAFLFGILLVLRPQDEGDVQQTTALVFAFFAWVTGAVHVVTGFATRTLALELRALRLQVAELGGEDVPARLVLGGAAAQAPAAQALAAQAPDAQAPAAGPTSEDPSSDEPPRGSSPSGADPLG